MTKVYTHGGQNITSDQLQTGLPSDHPQVRLSSIFRDVADPAYSITTWSDQL